MSSAGGNRGDGSFDRSGPSRKGKGKASEYTTDITHGCGNVFDISESPSVGEALGEYVPDGEIDCGEDYQDDASDESDDDSESSDSWDEPDGEEEQTAHKMDKGKGRAQDVEAPREGPIHDAGDFINLSDDDEAYPEYPDDEYDGGQAGSSKGMQTGGEAQDKPSKEKSDLEKTFMCPVSGCPMRTTGYTRADHLRRHMYDHIDSRPYKCPVLYCGYDCKRKDKIKDHLVATHKMEGGKSGAAQDNANTSATAAAPDIARNNTRIKIWLETRVDPGQLTGGSVRNATATRGDHRQDSIFEEGDASPDDEERRRRMELALDAADQVSTLASNDGEVDYGEEMYSEEEYGDDEAGPSGVKRQRYSDESDDDEFRRKMTR